MNNEKIIEILSEWNFWGKDHDVGVFRDKYLAKLNKLMNTGQVVAVTGVRRSGKSTLMKQFIKQQMIKGKAKKNFLYINLEETLFADHLSLNFLQQIYDAYFEILKPDSVPYILLDEVQNIPKWEKFVRSLHEKKQAKIIVSGSTSKLLGREFGTVLTGRWVELKLYPVGFFEFLEFKKLKTGNRFGILSKKIKIKQFLREYLEFGGFPLVVLKEEKKEILQRYFDDIMERDIAEKHKIRRVDRLKSLARYYLTNFSSTISYRRITKFMDLSLDSVERFSSYMAEAYLTFFVPKFSYSLKEQEINPRKIYCIDSGLINMVGFKFSENIGRLYENLVFLTLLREGKEIYYYKNKGECDFVLKEGQKIKQAIQVSYQIKENKEREIKGLLEAMNTFKLKEGFIITEDKEGEEKIKGKKVKYIPLWKWLLQ
ncbi:MAG: ATP-binding protein [Nanoarchaeota archaeon]|nr:ATP-binding protein [Nanoarchaeota archaeon]